MNQQSQQKLFIVHVNHCVIFVLDKNDYFGNENFKRTTCGRVFFKKN